MLRQKLPGLQFPIKDQAGVPHLKAWLLHCQTVAGSEIPPGGQSGSPLTCFPSNSDLTGCQ